MFSPLSRNSSPEDFDEGANRESCERVPEADLTDGPERFNITLWEYRSMEFLTS